MNPFALALAGALRRLLPWTAVWAVVAAQAAPQLTAASGSIGGAGNGNIAAGCTTYGPSKLFIDFFGSGQGIAVPVGGIGPCGYVGQQVTNIAAAGSASAGTAVGPVILGNPGFAGFYTGSASALARFDGLHASAQGSYSSGLPGSPTALSDSASAAFFSDALTITSPLVTPASAGSVGYRFKVDGSLSANGTPAPYFFGETLGDLAFQHADGPVYGAAHFYARRGEIGTATSGGVAIAGWTGTTGQVAGAGTVNTIDFLLPFPIVFGEAWDFTLGLAAHAIGESAASFLSTAQLVGLDVFDAQGRRIDDFTLTSASGTRYIAVVPEPASATLVLLGMALVTGACGIPARRRHRHAPAS